jgi:2-dehydropantoate 2-reductase
MKLCIFGGGAIGGYLAAHLAHVSWVDLSLVVRGEHFHAIKQDGLRLISPGGERCIKVKATDNPTELGHQDVVILALKSHQVTPALEQIKTLLGPDTVVIPPTTGIPYWYFHQMQGPLRDKRLDRIDPSGLQWKALEPRRVLGCVYWVASEVISPGVIHHDGSLSRFPIGEPDGSNSLRIELLAKAFSSAGLEAPIVSDIRSWIWAKMISSLCWNPMAVLTKGTLAEMNDEADVVDIVRRMMAEADDLALRSGVQQMPISIEDRIKAARMAGAHKMSMLQDFDRHRPLEIDVLLDSVSAMKELVGGQTPTLNDIYALLKLRIKTALTPDALLPLPAAN